MKIPKLEYTVQQDASIQFTVINVWVHKRLEVLDYLQLEICVDLGITVATWLTGLNWHLNAKQ
jgi:hypothetical protein